VGGNNRDTCKFFYIWYRIQYWRLIIATIFNSKYRAPINGIIKGVIK